MYYMHSIVHDWSEKSAHKILEMLRDALKLGYSKLLIYDHVVPDKSAHHQTTFFDRTMMAFVAGQERTETEFRTLIEAAGYRFVKFWRSPLAPQAIVEAEVANYMVDR